MTITVRPTDASAHERVAELSDIVAAHATDADRAGRLADEVVEALHDAHLFRMLLPRELEGLGLTPPEAFDIFEAAARLDGAVLNWRSAESCRDNKLWRGAAALVLADACADRRVVNMARCALVRRRRPA